MKNRLFDKKSIFSIRKLTVGVVSLAIGTSLILGTNLRGQEVYAEDASSTTSAGTTNATGSSNGSSTSAAGTGESASTTNGTSTNASSSLDLSGIKLTGRMDKTSYPVDTQILSRFTLNVSEPSQLPSGAYLVVTVSDNEPIQDFNIGSGLTKQKISDNQYKIFLTDLNAGQYVSFTTSYRVTPYQTGRNSTTTISAKLYLENDELIKEVSLSHTNETGKAFVTFEPYIGINNQNLIQVDENKNIVDSNSQPLLLGLRTTNTDKADVTHIAHAVQLPQGVKLHAMAIVQGWTLDSNNVAHWSGSVADAKNINAQILAVDVSGAATGEEFLAGKALSFTDTTTYTDKSGETCSNGGTVNMTITASQAFKGDSVDPDLPVAGVNPLVINNFTRDQNHDYVINAGLENVDKNTDDTRIIVVWRAAATPTELKAITLDITSDFDQKRSVEFYGAWTPGGAYAKWYADAGNYNTDMTLSVYSVAEDGIETYIGDVNFSQAGQNTVDVPDGVTKLVIKPKTSLKLDNAYLTQFGIYLHQNLEGMDQIKDAIAKNGEAKSVVKASVYTVDNSTINSSTSVTEVVDSRTAIKLSARTGSVDTALAGSSTQTFDVGAEAYNYTPNGVGSRVYNSYSSHGYDSQTNLAAMGAKNAKLYVELPDGFSYHPSTEATANSRVQTTQVNGKTVLVVDVPNASTRANVYPGLAFDVADWVPAGTYEVRYTLVWDENKTFVGLNPNASYEQGATTPHTSTLTYLIPVNNTKKTTLQTVILANDEEVQETQANPGGTVTYKMTLTNNTNDQTANNSLFVSLPAKGDTNLVDQSKARNSQFAVNLTGPVEAPAGWTAYYFTAVPSDLSTMTGALTAAQVSDWSSVRAVKFVMDADRTLAAYASTTFTFKAQVSKDAKGNQVAYLSAAAKTDGNNADALYNESGLVKVLIPSFQYGQIVYKTDGQNGVPAQVLDADLVSGADNSKVNYTTADRLKTYEAMGYKLVLDGYPIDATFDADSDTNQEWVVTLTPEIVKTTEDHKVTRIVKFVDQTTKAEIADKVEQTASISREITENKVTKEKTEGAWTSASLPAVQVPETIGNYERADQLTYNTDLINVTSESTDINVEVPYRAKVTEESEEKTITRTIHYVDKETNAEVAPDKVQTVTLKRTNKRNLVTNVVTPGTWTTGNWEAVDSPSVENYNAPDIATVESLAVTSDTANSEVTVRYTQSTEAVPESKVVTRTIHYVDKETNAEVAPDKVQTVTLTRTNTRNKVTNVVTPGTWTTGNWEAVDSPSVENYNAPDIATVESLAVTADTADSEVTVHYTQGTVEEKESKVVKRKVSYIDVETGDKIAGDVDQEVTLSRTNTRNLVTKALTEGTWSTGNMDAVAVPQTIGNYVLALTGSANTGAIEVTHATEDITVVIPYNQGTEAVPESKVVTRTIHYVDKETNAEVAPDKVQTVTLTRTNTRNKVTGVVTPGTWTTGNLEAVDSPSVKNYNAPDIATVESLAVTSDSQNSEVTVHYTQGSEAVPESKVVTRTIHYVDKETNAEVAPDKKQTVTLTRTNTRNKVTGVVTEGTWTTGNWETVDSPSVENYNAPDIATVESLAVTADTADSEVTVRYTQGSEAVPESKVVTRTIHYVDKETNAEVAPDKVQTVTLTRTNTRNKVTGVVTGGTWTTGNWEAVDSPSVENYNAPDIATVESLAVTSDTADSEVTVRYTQGTEAVPESKVVTRTIHYVDAVTGEKVADDKEQSVTLTRTRTTNLVTGQVNYSEWTTAKLDAVPSPEISGYQAPDIALVESVNLTGQSQDLEVTVRYSKLSVEVPVQAETPAQTPKAVVEKRLPDTGENKSSLALAMGLLSLGGAATSYKRRALRKKN